MAQTPYIDLNSEDILSAHISGLQHSVNKVEEVLNLKTATKTNYVLNGVADQQDPTLHNFIYEGDVRNWLTIPAPVIKRNGSIVPADEYNIQPAYGVVVFKGQQGAEYTITADFTHVIGESAVIETINADINALKNAPEQAPAGGMTAALPPGNLITAGEWITNFRDMADPEIMHTTQGVTMAGNTIDAYPVYLYEKTTVSKVKFSMGDNYSPAGNVIVGIYSNNNSAPKDLLASTPVIPVAATSGTIVDYEVNLLQEVVLEAGLYWLARYQSAGIKPMGYDVTTKSIGIKPPADSTLINGSGAPGFCVGVRTTSVGSISALPATFNRIASTTALYLIRAQIGSIWINKK